MIPCENCLTLAICKATTSNIDQTNPSDLIYLIHYLYNKCKLFKDYTELPPETAIHKMLDHEHSAKQMQKAIKYISEV